MTDGPILRIDGLSVRFGRTLALDNVNLVLSAGSVTLLAGENGAGKSTLLWAMSGLLIPTSGRVSAANGKLPSVGFLAHQPFLYEDLTVTENLELAARLSGMPDPADQAREAVERVGLGPHAAKRVSALSRGQIQRAAFARAVLPGPRLLLMDEPFSNVDPEGIQTLSAILRALRSPDRAIVIASHDRKIMPDISPILVELRGGKLLS
ncbi:ABC transporter ATP-binding protein [bacterium]|nr:ABC transporter ATP-binding protein [bacterium]